MCWAVCSQREIAISLVCAGEYFFADLPSISGYLRVLDQPLCNFAYSPLSRLFDSYIQMGFLKS